MTAKNSAATVESISGIFIQLRVEGEKPDPTAEVIIPELEDLPLEVVQQLAGEYVQAVARHSKESIKPGMAVKITGDKDRLVYCKNLDEIFIINASGFVLEGVTYTAENVSTLSRPLRSWLLAIMKSKLSHDEGWYEYCPSERGFMHTNWSERKQAIAVLENSLREESGAEK